MSGRRRRDGEKETRRDGDASAEAPRVRGAWTTPAVVVRRPDGSVVDPGEARRSPGARGAGEPGEAGRTPGARAPGRAAGRPRPRRIPGAPGAVRLRPTLTDAGDDPDERRRRRNPAATVTPLPPRPAPADADDPELPDTVAGADEPAGAHKPGRAGARARGRAGAAAPTAMPVPGVRGSRNRRASGPGNCRPPGSRPGEHRGSRVRRALSRLDIERLIPDNEEARARRALRLRRLGVRLAAVATAIVVVLGVFPVRTWINQRAAEERAREREAVFEREIDLLEDEVRDLGRAERIEEEARELGYVVPGEESYGILPAPETPEAPAGGEGAPGSTSSTTTTTAPPGG